MRAFVVAVVAVVAVNVIAAACDDVRAVGCIDDGVVDDAVVDAFARWPDLDETARPLIVACKPLGALRARGVCNNPAAESCALWGASIGQPARIVIRDDAEEETAALVVHELQHLRPGLPDMCRTHSPDCWED